MTLNYSGPNQGYFWQPLGLWRGRAARFGVCVFGCDGTINPASIPAVLIAAITPLFFEVVSNYYFCLN